MADKSNGLATGPEPSEPYIPPNAGSWKLERERVSRVMASLVVLSKARLNDDKVYGQWAGGYVEITDELLIKNVCPADLLGLHCDWDRYLPEGCGLIRLCKVITKHTTHVCPDGDMEDSNSSSEKRMCGHMHSEIDISCRFVVSGRRCKQVLEKNRLCSAGHDLEAARIEARGSYYVHKETARAAINTE